MHADASPPMERSRLRHMHRLRVRWAEVDLRFGPWSELGADASALRTAVFIQEQGFYTRAGFTPHGTVFDDAGLPHIEMRRSLGARRSNA
jgi:hypothetical protein